MPAKHIGILACSVEGAALCYRTIALYAAERMGEHNHPRVTLDNIAMAEWLPDFDSKNYGGLAEIMLRSAHTLADAGCDFCICPDNSVHVAYSLVARQSPIPWLHIAEVVAKDAKRRGFRKAGLLGTRFTMSGRFYREVFTTHQMEVLTPSPDQQKEVDAVIFRELVKGVFPEASRLYYNEVIAGLKQQGCDCAILGCTEIPLLVRPDDCPLPTLDSTRLLARAAVDFALADAAGA